MITVGILYGGRSGEHEVSLCSAASVVMALDKNRYNIVAIGISKSGKWYVQDTPSIVENGDFGSVLKLEENGDWYIKHFENEGKLVLTDTVSGRVVSVDVVFPVVHGTYCEDGTLQGLLELAMVPYVGADVTGSAVGMDKDISKRLLRDAGIPVVPWEVITAGAWSRDRERLCTEIIVRMGIPLFVKPCNAGSSVGVKKVKNAENFGVAVDFAMQFDNKVIIEKAVSVREIECSVLGNENPEASCTGEIIPRHEFYSYEAKYIDDNGADLVIPAELDKEFEQAIRTDAIKAFKALNCSGMARVDFFVERENKGYYINEINTIPGFTSISMYPKLWSESGLPYRELLDRLIDLALDRHSMKKRIVTELINA